MKSYAGKFVPDLELGDFDHDVLAQYAREVMLANHIHDRSALMQVAITYGNEAQTKVAIEEWMSSSPIYNERIRRHQKIEGDDVGVAFKSLQLDIGAPHNFLHLHYDLVSPFEGFFWTSKCGPYAFVRAISNADKQSEHQICHDMEDTTFDATVMAVNPKMRCLPEFRPPYDPGVEIPKTGPCRWRASIEDEPAEAEDTPNLAVLRKTTAASFAFEPLPADGDGMHDYSGPFRRDFVLSDLAHNNLSVQCKEFMLALFLLNYGCYQSIVDSHGEEAAIEIGLEQWRALAPITVARLERTFAIDGDDMASILKVLQLNPFVPREYFRLGFELLSPVKGRMWLEDCAALREPVKRGIASMMITHPDTPGIDAMIHAVNPRARMRRIDSVAADAGKLQWEIEIDRGAEPIEPSRYAALVSSNDLPNVDNSKHEYFYHWYD